MLGGNKWFQWSDEVLGNKTALLLGFRWCRNIFRHCKMTLKYHDSAPLSGISFLVCLTPDQAVLGLSPVQGHCVVTLGKTIDSHSASLHPVYKCVPAKLMLGVILWWTSIPFRGKRNIPSHFMLQKPELIPAWWATWLVCRLNDAVDVHVIMLQIFFHFSYLLW